LRSIHVDPPKSREPQQTRPDPPPVAGVARSFLERYVVVSARHGGILGVSKNVIAEVRGDDPAVAAKLRVEERGLEAAG